MGGILTIETRQLKAAKKEETLMNLSNLEHGRAKKSQAKQNKNRENIDKRLLNMKEVNKKKNPNLHDRPATSFARATSAVTLSYFFSN